MAGGFQVQVPPRRVGFSHHLSKACGLSLVSAFSPLPRPGRQRVPTQGHGRWGCVEQSGFSSPSAILESVLRGASCTHNYRPHGELELLDGLGQRLAQLGWAGPQGNGLSEPSLQSRLGAGTSRGTETFG